MNTKEITRIKKSVIENSVLEFKALESIANEISYSEDSLFGISPLLNYVLKRGIRINQLAKQGSVDDAEIIFRSYLEGFMKFMYIISSNSKEEYCERINEYFGILKDIGSISESNRYRKLSEAKINDNNDPYAKLVLTDEQIEALKQKPSWANRVYRQVTKNKWSYSKLSEHLSSHFKERALIPFDLLDHYYAIASHLVHCDESLFRNEWMKPHVGKDYLRLIDAGHISKLLTFVNELLYWLCLELFMFTKQPLKADSLFDRYKVYRFEAGTKHNMIMWEVNNYGK